MRFNRLAFDIKFFKSAAIILPIYSVYWITQNFNSTALLAFWAANFFLGLHVTMFAHRAWTHLSWWPSRLLNLWGLLIFTLGLSSNSIGWAATHRQHHHRSDTELDPHSPYYMSRWQMLFGSFSKSNQKVAYAKDLENNKDHLFFRKYYWHIHLVWFLILWLVLPELILGWIAVLGFHGFKTRLLNVIGHSDYVAKTHTNSPVFAYVYLHGEPWHANHHIDPKNWRFGHRWYELDVGAWTIWLCVKLKIAKARL